MAEGITRALIWGFAGLACGDDTISASCHCTVAVAQISADEVSVVAALAVGEDAIAAGGRGAV